MSGLQGPVGYEFGEFRLDATQRLLRSRADGQPLQLTSKAFETLLYLVEHRGELVEKAALMNAVWPNVVVEENNLNQCISALRRVLGESANEHRYIVTVPGRGYRFVAPVSTGTATAPADDATAATPAGRSQTAQDHGSLAPQAAHSPRLTRKFAWLVALGLAAVAVASWLWIVARQDQSAPTAAVKTSQSSGRVSKPRVAVLPFENLSPDPANAFFADGLHEEILSTLARRAPGMEVVSRTTMMMYRLKPKPLQQLASELGVSHVIEGSVRRERDQVRLTLQLVDARADRNLWSRNYDETLKDALSLQSDVAEEVATQLSVQLVGDAQAAAPRTSNPLAYDFYLKALVARQLVNPYAPIERYRDVDNLLSQAITLDPGFASAYAQRATFRGAMFAFNYDTSKAQYARIVADVEAGRRLAPHDPMVLAAEALYWSWIERDLPRAMAMYERARAAGLADTMFKAGESSLLLRAGHVDEALRIIDEIRPLDPGNPFILATSAGTLAVSKRPGEALRSANEALKQFPDDPSLQLLRAQIVFAYTGRTDEWRQVLERSRVEPEMLLAQRFTLLRFEQRYQDLPQALDGISASSIRVIAGSGAGSLWGVGNFPIAGFRGWTALLLGDKPGAANAGKAVLQYVTAQEPTRWNAWFLAMLAAQGNAFLSRPEPAIAHAREALALMPRSRDATTWMNAALGAAAVLAKCGAQDEATRLLEEVASATPGIGPAWIARDPLYSVPLARNERFRALVKRLEAQMHEIDLTGD